MKLIKALRWITHGSGVGSKDSIVAETLPSFKEIITDNLSGKWVSFPWLHGYWQDNLIHSEDLPKLIGQGIGIALCLQDEGDFIVLAYKSTTIRVKKEGVKRVMPTPIYLSGQQVSIKSKPELTASIYDFFWHHKDGRYCYRLMINNKINKKRYYELDLEAL